MHARDRAEIDQLLAEARDVKPRAVSPRDMVLLWLEASHHSLEFAVAVCEKLGPGTFTLLRNAVYGDVAADEVDGDELSILERGFHVWVMRKRKQAA